jgi:hypothetical protein
MDPRSSIPRETLIQVARFALAAAGAAALFVVIGMTRADVDLWGHVRFGLDILDSGRIVRADSYAFTSDPAWTNHEWLAEVIFAAAWRVADGVGLIAVKLACVLGVLSLARLTLKDAGAGAHGQVMLLGLTLVGVLARVNQVRPQIFSALLFAALILVLVRADRGRRNGLVWTAPLLTLWANLHGGWIVGLATLGLWALGDAWSRRASGWRALLVLAYPAAAALATLANPYGAGLWSFLFETVGFGREAIAEWGPAWRDPLVLLLWMVFSGLTAGALVRGARPRNPAMVAIPIAWGLAALRVSRLDAFFAVSVIGLLGPSLVSLVDEKQTMPRARLPILVRVATVFAVVGLMVAVPAARRALTCVDLYAPWWPEPELVAFARNQQLSGRVVTFFRWGEYGIWHLPPSLKVSMDGRRETVYSDTTIDGHLRLYEGQHEGLDYLKALSTDYVWLPRALPVSTTLQANGWVPIFQGPQSMLLARHDLAGHVHPEARSHAGEPAARCFPGP